MKVRFQSGEAAVCRRPGRLAQALVGCRSGNSAIEFALILPVVLLILLGLTDFGLGVYESMSLRSAARAAGQFAMKNPSDTAGITAAVEAASTLDPDTLTIAANRYCKCPDGSAVNCTSGICVGNAPHLKYVEVTVDKSYVPMTPWPGLPDSLLLRGTAAFRIQ